MSKIGQYCKITIKNILVEYYDFPEGGFIEPWLKNAKKATILFMVDIILSGVVLHMVLFPVYSLLTYFTGFYIPWKVVPLTIISYGFTTFMVKSIWEGIIKGKRAIASSSRGGFPRKE